MSDTIHGNIGSLNDPPHVRIVDSANETRVYIDGHELRGVRDINISHRFDSIPVIHLEFLASSVEWSKQ